MCSIHSGFLFTDPTPSFFPMARSTSRFKTQRIIHLRFDASPLIGGHQLSEALAYIHGLNILGLEAEIAGPHGRALSGQEAVRRLGEARAVSVEPALARRLAKNSLLVVVDLGHAEATVEDHSAPKFRRSRAGANRGGRLAGRRRGLCARRRGGVGGRVGVAGAGVVHVVLIGVGWLVRHRSTTGSVVLLIVRGRAWVGVGWRLLLLTGWGVGCRAAPGVNGCVLIGRDLLRLRAVQWTGGGGIRVGWRNR